MSNNMSNKDQYRNSIHKYRKPLNWIGLVIFICLLIVSVFDLVFIRLDSGQRQNVFSTGAQLVAGLFGLIFTGYTFFSDMLNKQLEKDDSLFDAITAIRHDSFAEIKVLAFAFLVTTILCFVNILFEPFQLPRWLGNALINIAMFSFVFLVFNITLFVVYTVNPQNISILSVALKKEAEKGITGSSAEQEMQSEDTPNKLADFIRDWNQLEKLINTTARDITDSPPQETSRNNYRIPQITSSVKILQSEEILSSDDATQIDELRRYRNAVVHSPEPSVSISNAKYVATTLSMVDKKVNKYREIQREKN